MQEVIKSIISIDKRAIDKEEDCKNYLETLDSERQAKVTVLKNLYESKLSHELLERKSGLDKEVEKESQTILEESEKQRKLVSDRFEKFQARVSEDAFKMILRNLEG